jgi:hypothetical protein
MLLTMLQHSQYTELATPCLGTLVCQALSKFIRMKNMHCHTLHTRTNNLSGLGKAQARHKIPIHNIRLILILCWFQHSYFCVFLKSYVYNY